jgi:hypothetical protein
MPSHDTEPSPCPFCGKVNDRASSVGGEIAPESGDYGVCFGCASVVVYGDDLKLRAPTEAELAEAQADAELMHACGMVTMAHAWRDATDAEIRDALNTQLEDSNEIAERLGWSRYKAEGVIRAAAQLGLVRIEGIRQ